MNNFCYNNILLMTKMQRNWYSRRRNVFQTRNWPNKKQISTRLMIYLKVIVVVMRNSIFNWIKSSSKPKNLIGKQNQLKYCHQDLWRYYQQKIQGKKLSKFDIWHKNIIFICIISFQYSKKKFKLQFIPYFIQ